MAEKEYIERDLAINKACEGCNIEFCDEPCEPSDCFIRNELLAIPAADVVEVRHAYWKETRHITISKRGREIHSKLYNCSYCDAPNGRKKSSYCHWCGAKMDGERKGQK